jgi:hypothetical protein
MNLFNQGITFKKTGAEVKAAVRTRLLDLEQRLQKRNAALEELLRDKQRLRSYLVRDVQNPWPRPLGQASFDVPSEDHQEVAELCGRVYVLEKEIADLQMILAHLRDDQEFELTFEQMVSYGFRREPPPGGTASGDVAAP